LEILLKKLGLVKLSRTAARELQVKAPFKVNTREVIILRAFTPRATSFSRPWFPVLPLFAVALLAGAPVAIYCPASRCAASGTVQTGVVEPNPSH
jgi:hypothetical protein